MIGSPDVFAFTQDDVFGENYADLWSLPDEFSVSQYGISNPWSTTNSAKFSKDFILISEFSEQVGPQPLLTIPNDPKVFGTFDLNYFSLRIMSVDYQASFAGHPPGFAYPKLSFVEDSKVVLRDSREGAFSYVHHLTLYDLEARGFVRPFCMAYISADERKIMDQFVELSTEFSKVSELLKSGNRKAFASELEKKIKDLQYTIEVLQNNHDGCFSAQSSEKNENELANIERYLREHKDLLEQINSYPNKNKIERMNEQNSHVDFIHSFTSNETLLCERTEDSSSEYRPNYIPQLVKGKSAKCFDKRLKTLQELCDSHLFQVTMDQLRTVEKTFQGDGCCLYTDKVTNVLLKKQKITNFLFEDDSDSEEGDIRKAFFAREPLPGANTATVFPEPVSLEIYISCEESFQLMGTESSEEGVQETERTESSPYDLMQDISDEGVEGGADADEAEDPLQEALGKPGDLEVDGCKTGVMEMISPDSCYSALYEEEAFLDCADVVREQICPLFGRELEFNGDSVVESEAPIQGEAVCCMGQDGLPYLGPLGTSVQKETLSCPHQESAGRAESARLSLDSLSPAFLCEDIFRFQPDDTSDTISFVSTSICSDASSSPCLQGTPLTPSHRRSAGQSTLRFIRQYSFAQQAIYSLLSGRTLVLLGSDEGKVRKLVNALTIFVPNLGKFGERVQPWVCSPFHMVDLQNWKLVGLHRMASPTGSSVLHLLSRYSRYISILDLDNKTLRSPAYCGQLLVHLADHRTQIKRGNTYYLHVQSLLTRLSSRAFLYTFCHHLHLPADAPATTSSYRTAFLCHRLGFSEEDGRIVCFLSELIKHRYLQRNDQKICAPVFRFNYVSSSTYKI